MGEFRGYTGDEPAGTVIVRVSLDENGARAHVRQVIDPADPAEDVIEQSEEMDVAEALALARNKHANLESPGTIVVELGPGVRWNEQWGRLIEADQV